MIWQNILRTVAGLRPVYRFLRHKQQFYTFRPIGLGKHCILPQLYEWNQRHIGQQLVANDSTLFRTVHTLQADYDEGDRQLALIIKEICDDVPVEDAALAFIRNRLEKVLTYNAHVGGSFSITVVPTALKALTKNVSDETIKLAHTLGACMELYFMGGLMLDDIMDNSIMRKGVLCWHKRPEVGFESCISDILMIFNAVHDLLKKYFARRSCYSNILDEFRELDRFATWAQCMDSEAYYNAKTCDKSRLNEFTPENYYNMLHYKAGLINFKPHIFLAMHLVGAFSKQDYEACTRLCLMLGDLAQIQDDFLDRFGVDIGNGRCTWFIMTALSICSDDDRKVIEENYGINNPEATARIREVYASLSLEDKYRDMERKLHAQIESLISELDDNVFIKDGFYILFNMVRQREVDLRL